MYYIAELNSHSDAIQYLNDKTTDLETIWITMLPHKCNDKNTAPEKKLFQRKYEAQKYLDRIRQQSKERESTTGHIRMIYGGKKEVWKIYRND